MRTWMFGLLALCLTACTERPGAGGQCTAPSGRFIDIPAGSFVKGADAQYPEERAGPGGGVRLHIAAFTIQAHEVTNDQFAAFVEATGYVTDAEKSLETGGPAAGSAVFRHPGERAMTERPWALVAGATWRAPGGPGTDLQGRGSYPVIHVSQRDAAAYAAWAGGRLPTEEEWEYAALLGLMDPGDPLSGRRDAEGRMIANTWQGLFPVEDRAGDGHAGLAPVGCYAPSRIGLYDMIGNVWEWTATPYAAGRHTIKGGSFLCADNFCRRYRPAARQPQESDFSTNHIGFRIVKDAQFGQ